MTKLRRQLQRELALRGRSPRTRESYERAVAGLPTYYHRSPDRIRDDEIKDRYTILSPTLLLLLTYWRAYRPRPWLFPARSEPPRPLSCCSGQYLYYSALEKAGLPRKGGIHALRHSFATHLLERGVDLLVVL